jgi:Resolvase, N terminal domain
MCCQPCQMMHAMVNPHIRLPRCLGLLGRNQSSEQLAAILDFIREGDTLVVTRIDRLARSIADLQDIVRTLKARGAGLRATEQPIDTTTAHCSCTATGENAVEASASRLQGVA